MTCPGCWATSFLETTTSVAFLDGSIHSLRYTEDILYPGERASMRQALAAVRHAEDVRREIRTRLGLKSP